MIFYKYAEAVIRRYLPKIDGAIEVVKPDTGYQYYGTTTTAANKETQKAQPRWETKTRQNSMQSAWI